MCLFFVLDTYVFFLHFRVSYLYKYLVVKRMGMFIISDVLDVREFFIFFSWVLQMLTAFGSDMSLSFE